MLPSAPVRGPPSQPERNGQGPGPSWRLAALAALGFAAGCGVSLDDVPGRACDDAHPCREGRACIDGFCFSPEALDAGVDAGATDAGGRDAGGPDAGRFDAGPQPTWQQRLHGFTGTTVDANCSVDIDPSRGNRVLAIVSSTDDTRDTATADLDTPARLPGAAYGHLRGRVTLPAPLGLRSLATFALLTTADGGAWLRLGFDAQGRLVVQSDAMTLGSAAMNESFARDGGFGAGDYAVDVSWTRGGSRRVSLDNVTLADTPIGAPGGAAAPALLRLGIASYDGDAGTGWSVTLSGWQAADDPSVVLGDVP